MHRSLTVIVLILLMPNLAPSQGYVAAPACQTFVSVGYVHGASDLNDFYSSVIDHYRALGIPIHEQTRFGRTINIEAGVVFSRIAPLHIGFALGYHFTPAYAAYQDFAGVLSIDGSVHTYSLSFVVSDEFARLWGLPVLLTIEPGVTYSSVTVWKDLQFTGRSQFDERGEWAGSVWGYHFRVLIGTSVPLGSFNGGIHVGYHKGVARVNNGSANGTGWKIDGQGPVLLNLDGPIVVGRLALGL